MTALQRDTVDYDRLLRRLVADACLFMGVFPGDADLRVVDGIGKSSVDFAVDTLILFLDDQVSCGGDEEGIFACLKTVMRNDILDARGSATARTTKKVEPVAGQTNRDGKVLEGLDDYPDGNALHLQVQAADFKKRLYELLEHQEPELYDLVCAVFEEDALTPRAIAAVIGTDADDIQNRKKRLRTFLAKQKIMKAPVKASK